MTRQLARVLAALTLFSVALAVQAETMRVDRIDIEGNTRVSDGTVLNYVTVQEGDQIDLDRDTGRIIRDVFASGLFDNVSLRRDGSNLVVVVDERPAIAEFSIEGNKAIPADTLRDRMRDIGLVRGRLLNRSTLDAVDREIREVYFDQGYYSLDVDTQIVELNKNEVEVAITVVEGVRAEIRDIHIVGNRAYDEDTLLALFEHRARPWNPFSTRDRYNKATLDGDIERLDAFYRDRGYLKFNVVSTQVSLGENPEDVFITVTVDEGPIYTLGAVRLGGDFRVPREDLLEAITVASGDIFSRREISASQEAIGARLGEDGYAFPDISISTEEDDTARTVDLNFIVSGGQRFYIRRIEFSGNVSNRDAVYRREMRIVEGSLFSPVLLRRSRERIQRLPFVDAVGIRSDRVAGRDDLLDVQVNVTEGGPGTFSASVGYGSNGAQFALNLDVHSAFGSGNNVKLSFSRSDTTQNYSISLTEPYYTDDGISRTLSANWKKTDTDEVETTSKWVANQWGLGASYGIPRSEYSTLRLGWGYDSIQIDETDASSDEITSFLAEHGDQFAGLNLTLGYSHDTRDTLAFPTRGTIHRLNLKGGVPNHDYPHYKLTYGFDTYAPLFGDTVLSLGVQADYGKGYGDTFETLPFFDRYYAGGVDSVRGFRGRSLGPRDSQGDAAGGDFRALGTLALLFPPPIGGDSEDSLAPRRTRMSLFLDAGNVFTDYDSFSASGLRLSYGIGLTWLSPVGPLKFSLAKPIEEEDGDDLEPFQFNISF